MTIALDVHGEKYGSVLANDKEVFNLDVEYSNPLFIGGNTQIGIWIRLTGATPDVSVYAEYSSTINPGDFSEVEGGSKIIGVTDLLVHNEVVVVKPSNYFRLRFKGNAGNGADITADAVVNTGK